MSRIITLLIIFFAPAIMSAQGIDDIPTQSNVEEGYELDSVIMRMKQAPLHNIEGVWQFVDNGATIAIERFDPQQIAGKQENTYRMVIIASPMKSIEQGTVMGYITSTAKRDIFEARIYTSGGLDGLLSKPDTFTLNLSDDNLLSFNEYKTEVRINLWRWIPYIYRVGVLVNNTRPKGLDGCIRIYPTPTSKPLNPRYL